MNTIETSAPAPAPERGPSVAEQFLLTEVAATRRALQRTRVAGVIIVLVVISYMSYVTKALQHELEPQAAAGHAMAFVQEQVNTKTDALASQVKERIPALVAGLPDYIQRELPGLRGKLEDRIEQDFRAHSLATAQQLGRHLDDFLLAHTVEIRTLLNMAENKPESLQTLAPDLEQEIIRYLSDKSDGDESLKEKIDHALAELRRVEQQVDRLAKGDNLSPQEKKTRYAIAVIARSAEQQTRQLELQIKEALLKAK